MDLFQVARRGMPVGGRVAGKVGIYSSHYNGNVNRNIIILTWKGAQGCLLARAPLEFIK